MATFREHQAFSRENYLIMLAGIALLAAGLLVMSLETAEHGFGFLGLTLGPVLLMLGFGVEFVAILYRGKPIEVEADATPQKKPEPKLEPVAEEAAPPAPKRPAAGNSSAASGSNPQQPARPSKKKRRRR